MSDKLIGFSQSSYPAFYNSASDKACIASESIDAKNIGNQNKLNLT